MLLFGAATKKQGACQEFDGGGILPDIKVLLDKRICGLCVSAFLTPYQSRVFSGTASCSVSLLLIILFCFDPFSSNQLKDLFVI